MVSEKFPTLLKRATDPAQKLQSNIKYVTSLFCVHTDKVQKNQLLDHMKWENAGVPYRFHLIPLGPFEYCLRLSIKNLCHDPLTNPAQTGSNQRIEYPESIAKDVPKVIDGLAYVYTTSKSGSRNRHPPKFSVQD